MGGRRLGGGRRLLRQRRPREWVDVRGERRLGDVLRGTVGDIADGDDYAEYHDDFGLFIYNFTHPSGARFQVIDYWTENLGSGYL
jgi:hypothetical protein